MFLDISLIFIYSKKNPNYFEDIRLVLQPLLSFLAAIEARGTPGPEQLHAQVFQEGRGRRLQEVFRPGEWPRTGVMKLAQSFLLSCHLGKSKQLSNLRNLRIGYVFACLIDKIYCKVMHHLRKMSLYSAKCGF